MENVLTTRQVSEVLGVSRDTVIRWVKSYNIDCETNESGHYIFRPLHVEQLKLIKEKKKIFPQKEKTAAQKEEMVPRHVFQQKLQELMMRIEVLQAELERKADEVVTYQLFTHRAEIDEMTKILVKLEQRVANIEEKVKEISRDERKEEEKHRSLLSIFSI